MKSAAVRFLAALGIASALVMSVTSVSFAQRNTNCIPRYDSSGAQTAPYCLRPTAVCSRVRVQRH